MQEMEAGTDAVELRPAGEFVSGYGGVRLGDDQFAIAWTTGDPATADSSAWVGVYDGRLYPVVQPTLVSVGVGGAAKAGVSPVLAFGNQRLLVVWAENGRGSTTERAQLRAAILRYDGGALVANGHPFALGSNQGADAGRAAAVFLDDRFVIAWQERSANSSTWSIRMTSVDLSGKQLFLGPSCDTKDFGLEVESETRVGDQKGIALAAADSNLRLQAIWADPGASERDMNPSGAIRGASIRSSDLVPVR
jgi:hypothetical protein